MLKVKNPEACESSEAQKRKQLVPPLHHRDVSAREFYCQRKNALSRFTILGTLRT
jgi:hypothetical protein